MSTLRGPVRNPDAWEAKQHKLRQAHDKKVEKALDNLVDVIQVQFDNELIATTLDAAVDRLIALGTLGALRSSKRIAGVLKRQNQMGGDLNRRESDQRNLAAAAVIEALEILEGQGRITVTYTKTEVGTVVGIAAAVSDELFDELEEVFALDPYEQYHPRDWLRSGPLKGNPLIASF